MTIIERLHASGIRRIGTPERGFRYLGPRRRSVSAIDRERIESLVIPPAWKEVAINPSPGGAVQAVGKDKAGRWQYLYHQAHIARRDRKKQERLIRFIEALPRMRRTVARELARSGISRGTVLAGILRILATCFLRPGSEVYANENGSFGLATMRRRHVSVSGDTVRFDFKGKSGRRQQQELRDPRLARIIRKLLKYPGEVFKYQSEEGSIVDIRVSHINAYIKEIMGTQFSAKDFRTWAGTLLCACVLARPGSDSTSSPSGRKRVVAAAIREVAGHLGNTPAVCRASYVVPCIIQHYEQGRVIQDSFDNVGELVVGRWHSVERSERALLRLLRSSPAGPIGNGASNGARPPQSDRPRPGSTRVKGGHGALGRSHRAQSGRASASAG